MKGLSKRKFFNQFKNLGYKWLETGTKWSIQWQYEGTVKVVSVTEINVLWVFGWIWPHRFLEYIEPSQYYTCVFIFTASSTNLNYLDDIMHALKKLKVSHSGLIFQHPFLFSTFSQAQHFSILPSKYQSQSFFNARMTSSR